MMKNSLIEKNASLWSQTDPKHAVFLPLSEDRSLKWCETLNGEPNLRRGKIFFHSQEGALDEARNWLLSKDLENVSVLYIYGVGLGYHYEVLKTWLRGNRKRHVVFLEDDLSVIYCFFQEKRATHLLKNSRAHLYYFQDVQQLSSLLQLLFWHFLKAKILIDALAVYREVKEKKFDEIRHEIVHQTVKNCATIDEYLKYGASFYRNFYNNLKLLPSSYNGTSFFEKFKGVPAIICGAGPSLEKNSDILKKLNDKALIFAGGSAMNALNSKGIFPHFGVGIDPNASQYERVLANTAYEIPYFYRNRMFWKAFSLLHGPKLYISGSGGYEVSKVFDEAFGFEEQDLDEGHNVVNFCVEIANRMGCNPIIFVGVDLAFTEMQAYAKGIVEERHFNRQEFLSLEDLDDIPVEREDIFGKKIYTLWKWIEESFWISDYAKENPHLQMLNATEGGLGFLGIQNLPLKEISFTKTFDLFGRIHGEIQNATCPEVTDEAVFSKMSQLRDSLKRCLSHLDTLLIENQVMQKRVKENKRVDTMQTGLSVLAETELEEEMAYFSVLEVFGGIASLLLNYEFRNAKKSANPELKSLKLNERKIKYVRQATVFNLELLEDVLNDQRKYISD